MFFLLIAAPVFWAGSISGLHGLAAASSSFTITFAALHDLLLPKMEGWVAWLAVILIIFLTLFATPLTLAVLAKRALRKCPQLFQRLDSLAAKYDRQLEHFSEEEPLLPASSREVLYRALDDQCQQVTADLQSNLEAARTLLTTIVEKQDRLKLYQDASFFNLLIGTSVRVLQAEKTFHRSLDDLGSFLTACNENLQSLRQLARETLALETSTRLRPAVLASLIPELEKLPLDLETQGLRLPAKTTAMLHGAKRACDSAIQLAGDESGEERDLTTARVHVWCELAETFESAFQLTVELYRRSGLIYDLDESRALLEGLPDQLNLILEIDTPLTWSELADVARALSSDQGRLAQARESMEAFDALRQQLETLTEDLLHNGKDLELDARVQMVEARGQVYFGTPDEYTQFWSGMLGENDLPSRALAKTRRFANENLIPYLNAGVVRQSMIPALLGGLKDLSTQQALIEQTLALIEKAVQEQTAAEAEFTKKLAADGSTFKALHELQEALAGGTTPALQAQFDRLYDRFNEYCAAAESRKMVNFPDLLKELPGVEKQIHAAQKKHNEEFQSIHKQADNLYKQLREKDRLVRKFQTQNPPPDVHWETIRQELDVLDQMYRQVRKNFNLMEDFIRKTTAFLAQAEKTLADATQQTEKYLERAARTADMISDFEKQTAEAEAYFSGSFAANWQIARVIGEYQKQAGEFRRRLEDGRRQATTTAASQVCVTVESEVKQLGQRARTVFNEDRPRIETLQRMLREVEARWPGGLSGPASPGEHHDYPRMRRMLAAARKARDYNEAHALLDMAAAVNPPESDRQEG